MPEIAPHEERLSLEKTSFQIPSSSVALRRPFSQRHCGEDVHSNNVIIFTYQTPDVHMSSNTFVCSKRQQTKQKE